MNIFKVLSGKSFSPVRNAMDYGKQKKDGSHDHRFNCGNDRTQAQKAGDLKPGKGKHE